MPLNFTPEGVPIYADWSAAAVDALFAQFKMLDAAQEGIDRSKLRTFYPYLGWNDIQKGLDALIASGRAVQSIGSVGSTSLELFTWKGV